MTIPKHLRPIRPDEHCYLCKHFNVDGIGGLCEKHEFYFSKVRKAKKEEFFTCDDWEKDGLPE